MSQPVGRANHPVRPTPWQGLASVALGATALAYSLTVQPEDFPPANKVIAFIRSEGCQLEAIKPKVNAAGEALVKDKATTWVAVDLPANPDRNVGMMGKPSPYLAAVEANAATSDLPGLIKKIRRALGTQCHVDVYSIHEGRVITPERTWKLGEPSPGGKGFIAFVRADGISLKTLDSIWGGSHAQLILSNRDRAAQSGRPPQGEGYRYIRNVVVGSASKDSPAIDGVAEIGGMGGAAVGAGASPEEMARRAQAAAAGQGGATPAPNRNQESAKRFMSLDLNKIDMFSAQEIILKD